MVYPWGPVIDSRIEDIVSVSISLLFCPFDLYFLGMGLGVWIIVGITFNLCSVFLVFGVLFLWFHSPRSDL